MKMTTKELAKKLNRHQSTVSRWFLGTRNISPSDAVLLEAATGIDRRAWLWPTEFPNPFLKQRGVLPAGPDRLPDESIAAPTRDAVEN